MVTRNTRERNLWNGDIGVTVKGPDGMVVLFPRGDKVAVCPVGLLPEHELAYAMTVHKSQGSEFGNVMVVLPDDEEHPLLNRQIVYTGITRAKKRAVILGTAAALKHAIETKVERDTGIELLAPDS
jgi:exodeoxyribonuclease V alpha subunit